MNFISTRNNRLVVSAMEAFLSGVAPDGGFWVPESIPVLRPEEIAALSDMDYSERAAFILGRFFPEIEGVLQDLVRQASEGFEENDPAPLVKLDEGVCVLELWHGTTGAWYDAAFSLLPLLMTEAKRLLGEKKKSLVVCPARGDIGPAVTSAFCGTDCDVIAFYPNIDAGSVQCRQMTSQRLQGLTVCGVEGNVCDSVRSLAWDEELCRTLEQRGVRLCYADTANPAVVLCGAVCYFSAYADLVGAGEIECGDRIDFCLHSGDVCALTAGYYAKRMGLPVGKLVCAGDTGDALTEFFGSGLYRTDGMDRSALQPLLYEVTCRNDARVSQLAAEAEKNGSMRLTSFESAVIKRDFCTEFVTEEELLLAAADLYDEYGYVAGPETLAAFAAQDRYTLGTDGDAQVVTVSCVNPYKNARYILNAIGEAQGKTDKACLMRLEEASALPIPDSLTEAALAAGANGQIINKGQIRAFTAQYIESRYK